MQEPVNMKKNLLRLYPGPYQEIPLKGLYLEHRIHEQGDANTPFVYANFLTSLDGRIALEDQDLGITYIPEHLTTDSDYRLFMELHAQADCLITHGGYLRALGEGRLGNILQIGTRPEHKDLVEWRHSNGLKPQPDVIIASASLDFPIHESLLEYGQEVYIATGKCADPERVKQWRDKGFSVLFSGVDKLVQGASLIHELGGLGYRSIYLIAGPQMLDTIVRERQLSRFYQTITHQLVGGKDFLTLLPGPTLGPEGNMLLSSLYFDQNLPADSGQFFTRFECRV